MPRVGILVLFLILEENLSAFHCYIWFYLWAIMSGLYYVELCSVPNLLITFFYKRCQIFLNAFSASIEMVQWFLSFLLLMGCITVLICIFWTILEFEGHTHTWSWLMILSMCCWIWFAVVLLETFISIHLGMLIYSFLFSVVLLSGYGIRIIMAS